MQQQKKSREATTTTTTSLKDVKHFKNPLTIFNCGLLFFNRKKHFNNNRENRICTFGDECQLRLTITFWVCCAPTFLTQWTGKRALSQFQPWSCVKFHLQTKFVHAIGFYMYWFHRNFLRNFINLIKHCKSVCTTKMVILWFYFDQLLSREIYLNSFELFFWCAWLKEWAPMQKYGFIIAKKHWNEC